MTPWLLTQLEKDSTTTFSKRELLRQSEADFERLKQLGLLIYVQPDSNRETYPCLLPCSSACPKDVVEMNGGLFAICPNDSEIDPITLREDDLPRYAFCIEKLFGRIREANKLDGNLHPINEDYTYLGYTKHRDRRIGFVFGFAVGSRDVLELSCLKRLCTDDNILVAFNPVSVVENVRLKRELHLQGIVQTSLAASVDFATFTFSIERLVSQVSAKEEGRLVIDRERSEVRYRGKTHRLTLRQVDFLESLCKQPGVWIPGSQIKRRYDERLDKVKSKLPAPIRKLIESHTVNGYRLNLP